MRKGAGTTLRVFVATWVAGAAFAEGDPPEKLLAPEQVEDLAAASDAILSPDGSEILYGLRVPRRADEEPGPARHELRVVPAKGGDSRLLVPAFSDPSQPAWSPDGRWISFVSSRRAEEPKDEEPMGRVFLLPAGGGEARPISPRARKVGRYRWSPDGKAIAVLAREPDPATKKEAAKKGTDWVVVDRDVPGRRLWRVDVATGEAKALTEPDLVVWDVDWSPDGTRLVAAVTDAPARVDDEFLRKRLIVFETDGGPPRLLLPAGGKLDSPRWSPDGRLVAFLGATDRHDPAAGTIYIVPAEGGTPRSLAPGSAIHFRRIAWLSGERLAGAGEEGVRTVLAVVSVQNGSLRRVLDGGIIFQDLSVSANGASYAFAASAPTHPAEVFFGRFGGGAPSRRTSSNPALEGIPLGEQTPFEWTARDGERMEGVLLKPVGFRQGERYPVYVTPHGGPESASLNGWNASYVYLGQLAAVRGYLVLLPNFRGSTGRGEAFSRANHGDLAGAEFDDVLAGVEALVDRGWADPERVAIGGGSYGGYFAAWGATRHTSRFAAAIVFAGITNWTSMSGTSDIPEENARVHWGFEGYIDHMPLLLERSPVAHAAAARTPTLILHGGSDPRVPVTQGTELYTALRLRDVPVEMVVYPRAEHGLTERAHRLDAMGRTLDWLERHLGAAQPLARPSGDAGKRTSTEPSNPEGDTRRVRTPSRPESGIGK